MNWKLIKKGTIAQPKSGTYSSWKPKLAIEGHNQCVYCSIHDSRFGGQRNFHVEHYKPKSKFPLLEKTFSNLFYACAICNVFKGDDWYDENLEDLNKIMYPNPSITNYKELFDVDTSTGEVNGIYITSQYLVEKLALNRVQLILDRKLVLLFQQKKELQSKIKLLSSELRNSKKIKDSKAKEYLGVLLDKMLGLEEVWSKMTETSPYNLEGAKRP